MSIKINTESIEQHDYNRASGDSERSNWRHHLTLDEDGVIDVRTSHGNATGFDIWHNRTLVLARIPDGTADVCPLLATLEGQLPTLAKVHAHHDVRWDGSNHIGTWTDPDDSDVPLDHHEYEEWVREPLEAVEEILQLALEDCPRYWDAGDWIWNGLSLREIVDLAYSRPDLDDMITEARAQDCYLDRDDLEQVLADARERFCEHCYERHCYCACEEVKVSEG